MDGPGLRAKAKSGFRFDSIRLRPQLADNDVFNPLIDAKVLWYRSSCLLFSRLMHVT